MVNVKIKLEKSGAPGALLETAKALVGSEFFGMHVAMATCDQKSGDGVVLKLDADAKEKASCVTVATVNGNSDALLIRKVSGVKGEKGYEDFTVEVSGLDRGAVPVKIKSRDGCWGLYDDYRLSVVDGFECVCPRPKVTSKVNIARLRAEDGAGMAHQEYVFNEVLRFVKDEKLQALFRELFGPRLTKDDTYQDLARGMGWGPRVVGGRCCGIA